MKYTSYIYPSGRAEVAANCLRTWIFVQNVDSNYAVVKKMFDERFPDTPRVITLASVCRPGWLIEMECMEVKKL